MKHLSIAIAILAVILTWCIFSTRGVAKRTEETEALLKSASIYAQDDNFSAARNAVRAAQASWKRHSVFLGIVLRHDEADEIVMNLAEAASYGKTESREEFLGICASLIAQLTHIREMERPITGNLM